MNTVSLPPHERPIGVFDSGVGGLTVVSALMHHMPQESILYLGDTARLPYGTKSAATIARYTQKNIEFLKQREVKALVVACNTASALGLGGIDLSLPLWGVVEPGAAAAVQVTRGRVGVIATESTISSDAYGIAIRRRRPDVEVLSQACPLFVPLVEEGWSDDPITEEIARRYLEPLLVAGIDTLVLGCTHYPRLGKILQRLAGKDILLVDSAETTAKQVAAGLAAKGLRAALEGTLSHHFCVTDCSDRFQRIAEDLLPARQGNAPLSLELVEV